MKKSTTNLAPAVNYSRINRPMSNRAEHKELKSLLIKEGITSPKARKEFHRLILNRRRGLPCDDLMIQDQYLLKCGYDSQQCTPLELRRNWQDQPD